MLRKILVAAVKVSIGKPGSSLGPKQNVNSETSELQTIYLRYQKEIMKSVSHGPLDHLASVNNSRITASSIVAYRLDFQSPISLAELERLADETRAECGINSGQFEAGTVWGDPDSRGYKGPYVYLFLLSKANHDSIIIRNNAQGQALPFILNGERDLANFFVQSVLVDIGDPIEKSTSHLMGKPTSPPTWSEAFAIALETKVNERNQLALLEQSGAVNDIQSAWHLLLGSIRDLRTELALTMVRPDPDMGYDVRDSEDSPQISFFALSHSGDVAIEVSVEYVVEPGTGGACFEIHTNCDRLRQMDPERIESSDATLEILKARVREAFDYANTCLNENEE